MNKKQIKRIYNVAIIAVMVLALGYVCSRFVHWGNVEYTNDAQVWRHITPLNARVGGFIKEIRFEDYQHVSKGDTLVIIEDAEYQLQLAQAETQMKHIAVGNKVSIEADAIPGVKYIGEVESIAGGTGSAFSHIPVDNATGNFVKVEQRVPVRIRLTSENSTEDVQKLLAGLNVETEVKY